MLAFLISIFESQLFGRDWIYILQIACRSDLRHNFQTHHLGENHHLQAFWVVFEIRRFILNEELLLDHRSFDENQMHLVLELLTSHGSKDLGHTLPLAGNAFCLASLNTSESLHFSQEVQISINPIRRVGVSLKNDLRNPLFQSGLNLHS